MGDILCLEDVPFQCRNCGSHFPTEASLKMHCFVEGHQRVTGYNMGTNCDCGNNPDEPHQCDSCTLIAISVEGDREGGRANDKVYTQSQLWKCSGCGMLWKCIECHIFFKGCSKFKEHLPRCNSIEDVLKRMKREKGCDDDKSDVNENKLIKGDPDIKQEFNVKEEAGDPDVKCPIKQEFNVNIKEERCDNDVKFPLKSETDENIKEEGDLTESNLNVKRNVDGNIKLESSRTNYHENTTTIDEGPRTGLRPKNYVRRSFRAGLRPRV